MRRKAKPQAGTERDYLMGQAKVVLAPGDYAAGLTAANLRIDDLRADMKAAFNRAARELDKRPTRTEMQESFAVVNAKLDRMLGTLDSVVGKQHDNERSHIVFDAMLGDHRRTLEAHDRRLTALESRLPPTTP